MREIKFRGLDKYGKWHYGYFWIAVDGTNYIKEDISKNHSADFEIIPETVGQYIGMEDKNRKEIYGGDILLREMPVYYSPKTKGFVYHEIFFDDFYGKFDVKVFPLEVQQWSRPDFNNWHDLEVIGNIYENKNLLDE